MSHRSSRMADTLARRTRRPASRPGPEVSPLHVGDPDFATPEFITRAMSLALEQGFTHYAQPQGDPELRAALAEDLSARSVAPVTPAQVTITSGGSPAINAAILATVNPGDRVVIPQPTYSLYADSVTMAGGECVSVAPGPDLHLDLAAVSAAAVGARMLVMCHPCNPTGVVYRRDEWEAVGRLAAAHDLLVLSDEAYDHIVFDGREFRSALLVESLADRLVYCQTFSKTYAMTGWRVGYVAAPADLAPRVGLVHRTFNGAVNSAVQRAALTAVRADTQWPAQRCVDYQRRRDLVVDALAGVPGLTLTVPEGTFYAFPRFAHPVTSQEMVAHALRHGVGLRAGSEFGSAGEGYVRLAFCVQDDELRTGLDRLRTAFASR